MVEVTNQNLLNYLKYTLNKSDISYDDLNLIKEVTFNPVEINNEYHPIDLSILKYFNNLEKIELINLFIKNEDIKLLSSLTNLESITFDSCEFEEEMLIRILYIKKLSFINSDIRDLDFVYNMTYLESLTIINDNVSIKGINKLKNLKYLDLTNSLIEDNEIIFIEPLEELLISNTHFEDLNFLLNMKNLKYISIDKKQLSKNKLVINKLYTNKVSIKDEMLNNYEVGDSNE